MSRSAWLGSMASQVFALLLVGIVAAATLAFSVSDLQRRDLEERAREQRVVDRVADLQGLLDTESPKLRRLTPEVGPEAPRLVDVSAASGRPDAALTSRLAARLGAAAKPIASDLQGETCRPDDAPGPPPPGRDDPTVARRNAPTLPLSPSPPPPTCRLVALTLSDGARVALVVPTGPRNPGAGRSPLSPAFLLVLAAAAALLAYGVARVSTGPLRRLSQAAASLGRDLDRSPLKIEGPLEVRQAAAAFNTMQERLQQTLEERTHMLAAITHDLQTPMTRLRLRLEKVGEPDLRAQLLADHRAMQEMIRVGLDLARASGEPEELVELNVLSLLQSLGDDAVAAGSSVKVSGDSGIFVTTRPLALARCVFNLLENALKYAGAAELTVGGMGETIIQVKDRGPGIPPHKLGDVLKPFFRLETSRSRETGGVGLGLSIAKVLAARADARLHLANRPGGGLVATVEFDDHKQR